MAYTQVLQSVQSKKILMPVSGAGSDIPPGTLLMPGVTGGTNLGVAIPTVATGGASSKPHIGIIGSLHSNSKQGDATTATLVDWFPTAGTLKSGNTGFPSDDVDLIDSAYLVSMQYSILSGDQVTVSSASGATLTVTSFEANYDSGFLYVIAGTGIGQLLFVASSSSGSCVLTSAATTQLDSTSKFLKIMPWFYNTPTLLVNTTTLGTVIGGAAGAGTARAICLGRFMLKNGYDVQLNPLAHHNTSGHNSASQLQFWSLLQLQNTIFHPNA